MGDARTQSRDDWQGHSWTPQHMDAEKGKPLMKFYGGVMPYHR